MENKKKEKLKLKFENEIPFFLSIIIILYFFYGFYLNENSAGAGGYNADFKLIWHNLTILKEDIFSNLSSSEYNDSRPPLSYILHIFLNPFIDNKEEFRLSNLLISSLIPYLLFLAIKENYKNLNVNFVFLLSVVVTLSPFFRTTSYWALGENYGMIFLLLSYLTFIKIKKRIGVYNYFQLNLMIFVLCLLSSLIVYFDQKLVFVPFLVLYLILNLKINIGHKYTSLIFFFIFSLPYFYLIYLWQGLIPTSANIAREVGSKIHFFNPGYCITMIAISIFPFIFVKIKNLKKLIKKIDNKKIIFYLSIFLIYALIVTFFGDFKNLRVEGKGAFHKISILLISDNSLRLFITLIAFLVCLIFTLILFNKKIDLLIISYLIILSLFTFPFYQEYLDPLLYILIFTFFKLKFEFNNKISFYLIASYYLFFSLGSKFYYQVTI